MMTIYETKTETICPVAVKYANALRDAGRWDVADIGRAQERTKAFSRARVARAVARACWLAEESLRWAAEVMTAGGAPDDLTREVELLAGDVCDESTIDGLTEAFAELSQVESLTGDYALHKGLGDALWALHAAFGSAAHASAARVALHEGNTDEAIAHAERAAWEAARVAMTDTLPLEAHALAALRGLAEVTG